MGCLDLATPTAGWVIFFLPNAMHEHQHLLLLEVEVLLAPPRNLAPLDLSKPDVVVARLEPPLLVK